MSAGSLSHCHDIGHLNGTDRVKSVLSSDLIIHVMGSNCAFPTMTSQNVWKKGYWCSECGTKDLINLTVEQRVLSSFWGNCFSFDIFSVLWLPYSIFQHVTFSWLYVHCKLCFWCYGSMGQMVFKADILIWHTGPANNINNDFIPECPVSKQCLENTTPK